VVIVLLGKAEVPRGTPDAITAQAGLTYEEFAALAGARRQRRRKGDTG